MQKINENNLYLRILKFWEAHPKGFTYYEIKAWLSLEEWEDNFIQQNLINSLESWRISSYGINPNLETIFVPLVKGNMTESKFILKYDAYFNYIDYLELQKAIENSKEASSQARLAIYIAVWLWLIQIIVWIIQISITK